jgi:2-C-methyl-D-erythritol 4-phosphate cytidylyltransferase
MALFSKKKNNAICSAVIVAAGSSQRMGQDKQFLEIHGKPALLYSLEVFNNCRFIDEIIVVTRADCIERVQAICVEHSIGKVMKIMAGGETRVESVMNGVFAASKKSGLIAVHDGARPCVTEDIIVNTINAVNAKKSCHAAAPAVPVSSTIKRAQQGIVAETVDRENLYEIQTPQVFTAEIIKAALTNAKDKGIDITDDCMAAERIGIPVHLVESTRGNIKLTTREDVLIAETILRASQ